MLAREPHAHVLIFSVHEEAIFVRRALDAGARGCVTKANAPDVLVEAVRSVVRRVCYLSPDISQALALRATIQEGPPGRQLSAREFEVLRLLVQGYTLPSIAEKLGLSQKTVAHHQSMIRQKFSADNGVQLAQIANRLSLHFAGFAGSADAAFSASLGALGSVGSMGNGSPASTGTRAQNRNPPPGSLAM
ncbi:Methanol utilization control regulatory protein MoxX [Candidatus Paraburkholderia kirkii UZHbot1]|uniref:Methanol utilization control regulatory protein MoxX n=1 Tax=Candidatus Paraburkholderia kirkii UZHbot1 TaxID=1055526 RepID=G4M414_9BURK|nr:Methanol utilization control regulatory protein MoxX [Candidatus Paraburkholderia kirkii UZHbot1]